MQINFEELENLIKQGQLEECLAKLKEHSQKINFRSLTNDILNEQSRLKTLNKKYHSGLIKFETYSVDEGKIRTIIINFFGELKARIQTANKIGESINNTNKEFQNKEKLLEGVWACKHSSLSVDEVYFWSLLPDNFCMVNILNKITGETRCKMFWWNYDTESSIIIQKNNEGEIKGIVAWISPLKFQLTVLDYAKSIMIYEKLL